MHTVFIKRKLRFVLAFTLCASVVAQLGMRICAIQIEGGILSASEVSEERKQEYLDDQEIDSNIEIKFLQTEENIQYYAYLDMEEAEEELKPVILAARNRIICRYSWVADGVSGRILDQNKTIKRELPQFSEIFPADWEEPVYPVLVDLSYYES